MHEFLLLRKNVKKALKIALIKMTPITFNLKSTPKYSSKYIKLNVLVGTSYSGQADITS